MWRHGDVLIAETSAVPEDAMRKDELILAYGEMTGHAHRVEAPESAELWEHEGTLYLRVITPTARIVHEEHKAITLPKGIYRVWKQREYTPGSFRLVAD